MCITVVDRTFSLYYRLEFCVTSLLALAVILPIGRFILRFLSSAAVFFSLNSCCGQIEDWARLTTPVGGGGVLSLQLTAIGKLCFIELLGPGRVLCCLVNFPLVWELGHISFLFIKNWFFTESHITNC